MSNKFGFTGKSNFFSRLGAKLHKGFYNFCTPFGTIVMTVGGAYAGSYQWKTNFDAISGFKSCLGFVFTNPVLALAVGGFVTLVGARGTHKDQERLVSENDRLSKENEKVSDLKLQLDASQEDCQNLRSETYNTHKKLVETWLKSVFKQMGLDSHCRVTIYYEDRESFYLLARYSANPMFSKEHRQKFPLNNGVISQVWQHSEYALEDCPSYTENKPEYCDYMEQHHGYDAARIDQLSMKSNVFYGLSITDADDNIGVILVESDCGDLIVTKKQQIKDYCTNYQSHLSAFVRDAIALDKTISQVNRAKVSSPDNDILSELGGM
ncbi:hypothetical protein FCV43_18935 [Vibrio genomosp. F6]|uniref:hypothetical protein n=1 Tax=Vibrio genomosp. F6 TaxID=723172 RepID=UPI0010BD6089|nr:hypothetical protein [Vibrio genomosp. F6]TKF15328.1 hypothetical protein FCV43_18935 [Vibrio genomosp. F6]